VTTTARSLSPAKRRRPPHSSSFRCFAISTFPALAEGENEHLATEPLLLRELNEPAAPLLRQPPVDFDTCR